MSTTEDDRDRERIPDDGTQSAEPEQGQPQPEGTPNENADREQTGTDADGNPVYGDRRVDTGDEGQSQEGQG